MNEYFRLVSPGAVDSATVTTILDNLHPGRYAIFRLRETPTFIVTAHRADANELLFNSISYCEPPGRRAVHVAYRLKLSGAKRSR